MTRFATTRPSRRCGTRRRGSRDARSSWLPKGSFSTSGEGRTFFTRFSVRDLFGDQTRRSGMALTIGDEAPNFTAQTTEGEIDLPRLDRRLVGGSLLPSEGLHAGLHDRARLHGLDQAGVRQARRQDHRPLRRSRRQALGLGRRHRGDAGDASELSDHRRLRLSPSRRRTGCCRPTSPATPPSGRPR